MASAIFDPEELKLLTRGSYEELLPKVHEALTADRKRLFGVDEAIDLHSTFNGHAIVLLPESGQAFRVKYETADNGAIVPVSAESLGVKTFDEKTIVAKEAKAFVEAFLSGARTAETQHFSSLVFRVKDLGEHAPTSVTTVLETFQALVKTERPWKKIYKDKISDIREEIKSDIASIDANRLRPKYRSLSEQMLQEQDRSGYAALVTSDLKYIESRILALDSILSESLTRVSGVIPALKAANQDPTIAVFESFAQDLAADVHGVVEYFVNGRNRLEEDSQLNLLDAKGKLYDVLASELHSYEVAANFVATMSRRLAETAVKGI